MAETTSAALAARKCKSCEGGVPPLSEEQSAKLLPAVPGWTRSPDGKRLMRSWRVKDFAAAMDFFVKITAIAEAEDHHPDLHLTGYRNAAVELTTHAIGGLSANDFIVAAKIDKL